LAASAVFAVFAALIHFAIAHLLLRLDPKREPVFAMQPWRPHHLTSGRACGLGP